MTRAAVHAWLRRGGAGVLALAALGAACGKVTPAEIDTDGGGGDTVTPLTADQACGQEAQAICDALAGCATFWIQLLYGDKPTCVARQKVSCMDDQSVVGTTRAPADIVACAQAGATATCPDLLAGKLPAECQLKPGVLVNGRACGSDWQCQSTYCNKHGLQCGTCGPRAAAGADCADSDGCQTGLVCAGSRCVTPGVVGGACDATIQPCRSDLYCTPAATCAKRVGVGGSCADSSDACAITQGVACNGLNHVCEKVAVAAGGAACGIVDRTLTLCVALDPCVGATLTAPGVCADPAGDGEACGKSASNRNCLSPATCDMDVCRLPSTPSCM
jgi:hypothetical protein